MNLERQTYTVRETAAMLGLGKNQAYQAVREGLIPAIRVGRRLLIPRAAFDRFLRAAGTKAQA